VSPSYPADLFDALFQLLPSEPEIVEVGPGTGQATKDLLTRGASVLAIEIGPAMAAKLRAKVGSDRLRVMVGDFVADLIVEGVVLVELKAVRTLAQCINYLAATRKPICLLINFSRKVEVKRFVGPQPDAR